MCRMLEWFVLIHLRRAGWPRQRGLSRKMYVDAHLAAGYVELGLMLMVGLGAGRPESAVKLIVMTFEDNPWTATSTALLFEKLSPSGAGSLAGSGILPWRELANSLHIPASGEEIPWEDYNSPLAMEKRAMAATVAVYWGLTNPTGIRRPFEDWKREYRLGLTRHGDRPGIPQPLGVDTLADFFQYCEEFVRAFGRYATIPNDIPPAVRARPEVAARL